MQVIFDALAYAIIPETPGREILCRWFGLMFAKVKMPLIAGK
jgi:hypothetical protein